MSKPNRDTQLRDGEQRLHEWSIAADASVAVLRAAIGRDPAADVAIGARLGAHANADSVDALLALESGSTDKLVHKEVRRSLYRLEQRGIQLPAVAAPAAAPLTMAAAVEGYISAIDGRGDQLVWLVKPRPAGVAHLFAVINDPEGLREVELTETTRKAVRAGREQLLERHEIRMIEVDWHYADFLIDRAFRWATERKSPSHGDYRGLRAQVVKESVQEMPLLILTQVDAETVRADPRLLHESDTLLTQPEFRTWLFTPDDLKPYLDELQQMKNSPLVLSEAQQQERFRQVIERALEEIFGGALQSSWVRRLEEMAYFLHATARPDLAQRALAAALALERSSHGGREIPFCEVLTRTCLAAIWQHEEQREVEETRGSLVLTPQQVARESQRRRS